MDASGFLPDVPAHWSVYFRSPTSAPRWRRRRARRQGRHAARGHAYGQLATLTDPNGAMFKLLQGP